MPLESPILLGIETSCDDTACAIVDGAGRVAASVVSSQLAAHRPFGGVVPEIASREHLANWPQVSAAALDQAGIRLSEVDGVAATRGPGLVGALLVGLSLGKAIAYSLARPFHAVHHLEAHLYSPFLHLAGEPADPPPDRFVGLVASGGHTVLFAVEDRSVSTLAETRDDAMGEVFDKVGKRLGLPYPQGPQVDALAERGDATRRPLPVPAMSDGSLDFSFSGLKSQALAEIDRLEAGGAPPERTGGSSACPTDGAALDLLAGFRAAAVGQLLDRLERLAQRRRIKLLAVSGGVAANRLLRREVSVWAQARGIPLRLVPLVYAGDNAAMVAHAALLRQLRGCFDDPLVAEAASRIPLP